MNKTTRNVLAAAALLAGSAFSLKAASQSFDFKDPKGVNNVQFHLDAPLESIAGTGNGIEGTIVFDAANPASVSGKITLSTESLKTANSMMTEHILGTNWLDAKANPTITFEAVKAANVKTEGSKTTADVTGKLTVKGVTKEVTVPVSFTYLKGKAGARVNKPELGGDLLVVRASFSINRSEFNIQPGKNLDKVSEEIALVLSLAGTASGS